MKSLLDTVQQIANAILLKRLAGYPLEVAQATVEQIGKLSMADILGASSTSSAPTKTATPAKRGPGRPKGGTNKPKVAKAPKAVKVDGDRFTADKVAAAALEVVKILKAAPAPMSTEEIRAKFQIEKPHWGRVSTYLRDQKLVKTTGSKREMKFLLRDNAAVKKIEAAAPPVAPTNSAPVDTTGTEITAPAAML